MRVLEFYGLPGVGKSTIAEGLVRLLHDEGLRVGTRETIVRWIARMPRREKLGFRFAAAMRTVAHLGGLWDYCSGTRPLRLRRYFLLFMKEEAVCRLRRSGNYDVLVLDQWLLQDLWSLFVQTNRFPADLPPRLWAATACVRRICHVSAPTEEVAFRLSSRTHGLSRFDGLDLHTAMSRLAEVEGFTRNLLKATPGNGEIIEIDGRVEVEANVRRLATWFKLETNGKGEAG